MRDYFSEHVHRAVPGLPVRLPDDGHVHDGTRRARCSSGCRRSCPSTTSGTCARPPHSSRACRTRTATSGGLSHQAPGRSRGRRARAGVYIFHALNDELIPIAGVNALVTQYCNAGVAVTYYQDLASDHISLAFSGAPAAIGVPRVEIRGAPAASTCGLRCCRRYYRRFRSAALDLIVQTITPPRHASPSVRAGRVRPHPGPDPGLAGDDCDRQRGELGGRDG